MSDSSSIALPTELPQSQIQHDTDPAVTDPQSQIQLVQSASEFFIALVVTVTSRATPGLLLGEGEVS